jgi:histone H3/H4
VYLNKMKLLLYMVINMNELPIAPFGRIIKNAGGKRIAEDAKEALEKVVEESAEDISRQAVILARHAGRVTVQASDIELAVKELS